MYFIYESCKIWLLSLKILIIIFIHWSWFKRFLIYWNVVCFSWILRKYFSIKDWLWKRNYFSISWLLPIQCIVNIIDISKYLFCFLGWFLFFFNSLNSFNIWSLCKNFWGFWLCKFNCLTFSWFFSIKSIKDISYCCPENFHILFLCSILWSFFNCLNCFSDWSLCKNFCSCNWFNLSSRSSFSRFFTI